MEAKQEQRESIEIMGFSPHQYVSDVQAAIITGHSPQSYRNWRHIGRGPIYHKCGRSVRYLVQDLLNFMAAGRIDPQATRK